VVASVHHFFWVAFFVGVSWVWFVCAFRRIVLLNYFYKISQN
jgi:hypothetical protein